MKTLVLGLGNPILTDDGVGVRVAEAVRTALATRGNRSPKAENGSVGNDQSIQLAEEAGVVGLPGGVSAFELAAFRFSEVDIQEISVGGLALMEAMIGYECVILVDAFEHPDVPPGMVHRMTLDDLRRVSPTQHSASPHDASLVTALELGQRMGLPLPPRITIYAIGVENVTDFSERLTPSVAAAVPVVTAAVLAELGLDIES